MTSGTTHEIRDHGGNLDTAINRFGGRRGDWIDLSTGINPVPYPLVEVPASAWADLPDAGAMDDLLTAARAFWAVPESADILAAPGASAIIAALPDLFTGRSVSIPGPTYNEHAAAFRARGWGVQNGDGTADVKVVVHPNNPDGRIWSAADVAGSQVVIDESFCDVQPDRSLVARAGQPGGLVLKSFGKFWGLAGLRLGFAIGPHDMIADLRTRLGPWAVSGPALHIGRTALGDHTWARETRQRLGEDAQRLDDLTRSTGASCAGGTSLFRLYEVEDAVRLQDHLAAHHIWSRVFPYSDRWIRLGLPAPREWSRVDAALSAA